MYNAMAALACGLRAGLTLEQMAQILPNTRGVRGRMELLPLNAPFDVLIDSAATPEQIDNLLMAARGLAKGRLLLVLGAPGDRGPVPAAAVGRGGVPGRRGDSDGRTIPVQNRSKRSADRYAPEWRESILRLCRIGGAAIGRALDLAQPGDLVLLSGRGDKTQMLTRDGVTELDERAVVLEHLRRNNNRKRKDA